MEDRNVIEVFARGLHDFGEKTRFGGVKLDDMSRKELYAVIKMLGDSSDLLAYSLAGKGEDVSVED